VDAGVLADVEGLEVEAVGADFEEQGIDEEVGEALAAVVARLLRRTVRSWRRSAARV
jgi:hypothetical protein